MIGVRTDSCIFTDIIYFLLQLHCRAVQSTERHPSARVERLSQDGDFLSTHWRRQALGYRRMRSHAERSCLGHLRSAQCRADRGIFRTQVRYQLCGEYQKTSASAFTCLRHFRRLMIDHARKQARILPKGRRPLSLSYLFVNTTVNLIPRASLL